MKKTRYTILFVLAALIIAARFNVCVGEWYSIHLYPYIPAVKYSAYYSLLPYVLSNASRVLDQEEYKEYVLSIRPEIRQQLVEQQEFWKSQYSKTLGKIQSVIYDSMLKANKIPSGTKNYSQVIELIIAAE